MSKTSKLRAGAAQVDITPEKGIQIAGDVSRPRPVETVEDQIFARALVLESDGRKVCLVTLDLCFAKDPCVAQIRQDAAKATGIAPEAIMLHSTHTHGAPALGTLVADKDFPCITDDLWWLCGDERYNRWAVPQIVEAIRQANANLQPASIGWGSGMEGRVAFNRRFVMRDGTVRTHPRTCDPQILHVEGPIDPEVGVIAVKGGDGKMIATLLHFSCHPTHGYPQRYITAGWPGAWAKGVRELCGEACVPLVLNGCSGNVHHHHHLDPTHDADHRVIGKRLTEDVEKILPEITFVDAADLDRRDVRLSIPMRRMSPERLAETRQYLRDHPEPPWNRDYNMIEWEWAYAVSRLGLHERAEKSPNVDCEIQAFRIGGAAVVGLPGELFVEGQLAIKLGSPFYPIYAGGNSNSHVGYVPTRRAFEGGGYETDLGNWSKLVPEALEMMSDAAIAMLKEMKEGSENYGK